MSDHEPRTPFSFDARGDEQAGDETAETITDEHRRLGRKLALGGLTLVLLATFASGIYVYRPAPVLELLRGTPLELAAPVTQAYKWRDADGNWQISDRQPPAGTEYEVIQVSTDTNVLPLPPKLQPQ